MERITVIVPCYNEEAAIPLFYQEISRISVDDAELRLLFIDDGSQDNTLPLLHKLNKEDRRVEYLSFSRNFGKEAAILAGLRHAEGEYVALMDVDLQDPPSLLPDMLSILRQGTGDCVATKRRTRTGEPFCRSMSAHLFYRLMGRISRVEIVDGARDFRMMTRRMTDAILSMCEYNRFSKGIFSWVGFDTVWLEYDNAPRCSGSTKWSFWKLFCYSLEGIIAFSTVPLAIASFAGILFFFISLLMIIIIILRTLLLGDPTSGWPSLVCLLFLTSGIQLFCTGILGHYLARTYLETKHRPDYIIREAECSGKKEA